jgi:hypothetical protein
MAFDCLLDQNIKLVPSCFKDTSCLSSVLYYGRVWVQVMKAVKGHMRDLSNLRFMIHAPCIQLDPETSPVSGGSSTLRDVGFHICLYWCL